MYNRFIDKNGGIYVQEYAPVLQKAPEQYCS